MIVLNLCLSDIPKEAIKKADNGKSYTWVVIDSLREPTEKENVTVYMSQSKEDREAKVKRTYIGRGKDFSKVDKVAPLPPTPKPSQESNDLPF